MSTEPLVSIICLTYNEYEFVRDTLDSFLAQITSFPYEVLVYDDASQDGTVEILKEYATKFPNIFKLVLYKENNFRKGHGFLGLREGFRDARGKYIAYCEGDDYWCDNRKLQKQVDFLEKHPSYAICAHETLIRNDYNTQEDGMLFTHTDVNIFLDRTKRNHYTFQDALTGNIFHISSLMFRNCQPIIWPDWICTITALDMVLFMILAERGDIWLMRDVMSVYRHNKSSLTSTCAQFENKIAFNNASISLVNKMDDYWNSIYHFEIKKIIARYYMSNMFCYCSKGCRDFSLAKQMAILAYRKSPHVFWKYFLIESWQKLMKHI